MLVFLPEDNLRAGWLTSAKRKGRVYLPIYQGFLERGLQGDNSTTKREANQAEGTGRWRDVTERTKSILQLQKSSHCG